MIYFWEVDPERLLTSINNRYRNDHFKVCSSCAKVCEVDKMTISNDYSVCFNCMEEDIKTVEHE